MNISLRVARENWKHLGGLVKNIRRTGEERYSHTGIVGSITVHKGRKDAPKKLIVALKRLASTRNGRR